MNIIIATSNMGKVKEISAVLGSYNLLNLRDIGLNNIKIIENKSSFKENSMIKAETIFNALSDELKLDSIVLSDDSGISVECLNNEPGIFSARYSKEATDKANRLKLIKNMLSKNIIQSPAFYTACISIYSKFGSFSMHGFMYGTAITKEIGDNGFGYDSIFIPNGYTQTLAQMRDEDKIKISHRTKAINIAKIILAILEDKYRINNNLY